LGNEVLFGVQLLAGMALVIFGFVFKATSDSAQDVTKKLRSISPVHTFLLGIAVMLNEITTALPYFVAIERIIRAQMDTIGNLLALAGYNVVFSLPLFGFLALYAVCLEPIPNDEQLAMELSGAGGAGSPRSAGS
jgi:cytochrome c biogenesis protein CcdA